MLKGNHITVRYSEHAVVDDLHFELRVPKQSLLL